MQRDTKLGTRNLLTEAEYKQVQERFARQAAQDEADFDLEHCDRHAWRRRGWSGVAAAALAGTRQAAVSGVAHRRSAGWSHAGADAGRRSSGRPRHAKREKGRGPADSYTDRSLYDRCISRGIAGSILPVIYNNGNEIVQAPGFVAIRNEMIHETRIVPLDGRPHPSPHIKMWMGDSRGHWDGDTLVVETKNIGSFAPGIGVNGGGTRHSSDITITERFTRDERRRDAVRDAR